MASTQNTGNTSNRTVAALGLFDGVHLGHRSVIELAASMGSCQAVTFAAESMPLKQGHPIRYIYGDEQRRRLLTACGADAVLALPFGEIHELDGLSFCRRILCEQLHVDAVVCGEDYRFGRGGACTAADLVKFGQELGFDAFFVPQVRDTDGQVISASHIRLLLENAQIETANRLLGSDYTILTTVTEGNHLGNQLGFPTANQPFYPWQCIPRRGVYASFACVDDLWMPAITNIGSHPTIRGGLDFPIAETHLLDWNGDLCGRLLSVTLCKFLRPEQKFESADALIMQIQRDIAMRKSLLRRDAL